MYDVITIWQKKELCPLSFGWNQIIKVENHYYLNYFWVEFFLKMHIVVIFIFLHSDSHSLSTKITSFKSEFNILKFLSVGTLWFKLEGEEIHAWSRTVFEAIPTSSTFVRQSMVVSLMWLVFILYRSEKKTKFMWDRYCWKLNERKTTDIFYWQFSSRCT